MVSMALEERRRGADVRLKERIDAKPTLLSNALKYSN